jgi:hypothetical protein
MLTSQKMSSFLSLLGANGPIWQNTEPFTAPPLSTGLEQMTPSILGILTLKLDYAILT